MTPSARAGTPLGNTLEISRPDPDKLDWLTPAQELDAVRSVTKLLGQRFCLTTPKPSHTATIERSSTDNPKARLKWVLPCGLMTCPNCARRLRARKAVEVELLAANLLSTRREFSGYAVPRTLHMVTLTVSHHAREPLAHVLERLQTASNRLLSGRMGTGWREQGFELVSRSLEVTYGANGWHPHLHLIVATSPLPLGMAFTPEAQAADLFMGMNRAWTKLAGAGDAGFRADPIRGRTIGELSGYVAGVRQAARGAALEGIRHDLKRGRHDNVTVFELPALLSASMRGERVTLAGKTWTTDTLTKLWREWEQAAHGVHQVAIGRGFSDLRPTREQIAERLHDLTTSPTEEPTTWEPVTELTPDDLRLMRRYGVAPVLKAAALHGETGVEAALANYRHRWKRWKRWKRRHRATISYTRSDGRDFVVSRR